LTDQEVAEVARRLRFAADAAPVSIVDRESNYIAALAGGVRRRTAP